MRKVERYSVQRVTGDGRCLFRALVFGNLSFCLVQNYKLAIVFSLSLYLILES